MTPEEAINEAIKVTYTDAVRAQAWVSIAAELRAQAAGPALAGLLGKVREQLPPENPMDRLTLHDIEAKICEPHTLIVIKRFGSTAWWMHVHDKTTCPDA